MADDRQDAAGRIDSVFAALLYCAFFGDLSVKWREVHMKELLHDLCQEAKALGLDKRG
jgi:type I restriction enzyme S subunit